MEKQKQIPTECPDDELFAAYIEGSLSEAERERIEEHLVGCGKCVESVISASESESAYDTAKESFATGDMVKKAKELVKPRETHTLFWERISSWFTVFRPVPVMVLASIILTVMVISIYNPSEESPSMALNIIARVPSEIVTRGTIQDYQEVEITDGGVLHSGDMFRITFELQEDAYVYLISFDSQGNLSKLFPVKDAELPIKVKANTTYSFPENDGWLLLDNNTGHETFFLIASSEPTGNIDQKIYQMKQLGVDKITDIFSGNKIKSFKFMHE